jgi:hypothetical protein
MRNAVMQMRTYIGLCAFATPILECTQTAIHERCIYVHTSCLCRTGLRTYSNSCIPLHNTLHLSMNYCSLTMQARIFMWCVSVFVCTYMHPNTFKRKYPCNKTCMHPHTCTHVLHMHPGICRHLLLRKLVRFITHKHPHTCVHTYAPVPPQTAPRNSDVQAHT